MSVIASSKKFSFEIQNVVLGEDDVQSILEIEKLLKNLGVFEGVEKIDEDTYKIVFHQLPQEDEESPYYWITVKVREEKNNEEG